MHKAFPELFANLDNIVSLPSVSSANTALDMSNGPVIDYLATCFEDLGFQCEVMSCASHSGKPKANLVATLGTGPGGLVLAGHTDTVPIDAELWSVNPFRLTEKDGRLYGLGTTDMKGFFPLVMEAVKSVKGQNLREPLIILATADEESSMEGARSVVQQGYPKARRAIIGEPTGLLPVRAHKGIMMESIRLLGQSGHSSDPALGRNALDVMHHVIAELMVFRQELREKYSNPLFRISYPTLNLGCIHGGDNPNRICGHCNLDIDIRITPEMNIDETREMLRNRIYPIAEKYGVQAEVAPLFAGAPAFMAATNSPLLTMLEKLTGQQGIAVGFGTEGPFLQELGMDTIIFGPGNIDQAHQPDEYMSLDMVQPCIDYLQKIIKMSCL
ncbi:MAG: acetylornithine deacetylase [Pseudohongiellaceae bacterium]